MRSYVWRDCGFNDKNGADLLSHQKLLASIRKFNPENTKGREKDISVICSLLIKLKCFHFSLRELGILKWHFKLQGNKQQIFILIWIAERVMTYTMPVTQYPTTVGKIQINKLKSTVLTWPVVDINNSWVRQRKPPMIFCEGWRVVHAWMKNEQVETYYFL